MKANSLKSRGIRHIEDLSIPQFISHVSNLEDFFISEKVDGSSLQFGIDQSGFFTGRELLGGNRVYESADYPLNYATTFQRSAHMALEQVLDEMCEVGLGLGDLIETEILFGELPNAVPYTSDVNRIIFLRKVDGDVNLKDIREHLIGKRVEVQILAPRTEDGRSAKLSEETHVWEFAQTPTFSVSKDLHEGAKSILNKLESYLDQNSVVPGFTVYDVMTIPLNKRHQSVLPENWKDVKAQIKRVREECLPVVNAYRKSIKNELLEKLVSQTKSAFGPDIKEGGWIEGVVFRHKKTNEQFKVIDRDKFTIIKNFLWDERTKLKEKSKSVHSNELSVYGNMLMLMSSAIGHPQLGTTRSRQYVVENAHTINFEMAIPYWHSLITVTENKLNHMLNKYTETYQDRRLVNNRKVYTYDETTHEKTLQTYHVIKEKINSIKQQIKEAEDIEDLIRILQRS